MKRMKFVLLFGLGLISSSIFSQPKQNNMTNQEVVEKFLNGFNEPGKIQESLALLADDYKFKNPMIQLQSKVEFIGLAQEIGKVLTGVNIIRSSGDGDWVAVFYEFKSSLQGLESNIATEWFRLKNGVIQESHLIYDASEWRKVYEQTEE